MPRFFDVTAFILAVVIETVLLFAAANGGPHGALGAWAWVMQFPGILLLFFGGDESQFAWQATAGALIQLLLWYLLMAYALRRFRERKSARTRS